ncbi:hypothetical protein HN873_005917, partial [Arachis hypogaea]
TVGLGLMFASPETIQLAPMKCHVKDSYLIPYFPIFSCIQQCLIYNNLFNPPKKGYM